MARCGALVYAIFVSQENAMDVKVAEFPPLDSLSREQYARIETLRADPKKVRHFMDVLPFQWC